MAEPIKMPFGAGWEGADSQLAWAQLTTYYMGVHNGRQLINTTEESCSVAMQAVAIHLL